jgi:hypothetical protein
MFFGGHVTQNFNISTTYSKGHFSLLRTFEDVLGLGNLGRNDTLFPSITGWYKA